MTHKHTLDFLYGLQTRGMKFGLANITSLLEAAGNPHTKFPAIHVAGTNGKGSTSAFLSSILMEHGLRTGLYTSPHLVRFTERIRINGTEMPVHRLVSYARRLRPVIEAVGATFFEATTAICFLYFADEKIDIGVIETGMGGRLDSTNVIIPLVSVITNISLEHREYLGNTLSAIAREKGGIIKEGVPCVTGEQSALGVLRSIAARRRSPLSTARRVTASPTGRSGRISWTSGVFGKVTARPGLRGSYQRENVRLAIAALEAVARRGFPRRITRTAVEKGIRNVVVNTGMRGRFERIGKTVLLDVAHNPAGMRTLARAIREEKFRISSVVFGVLKEKEVAPMIEALRSVAPMVVAVAPKSERARPVDEIRIDSIPATTASSVGSGLSYALRHNGEGEVILVTGSHYVVGEALEWLRRKKLDNPR